jgi:hypothetical protein
MDYVTLNFFKLFQNEREILPGKITIAREQKARTWKITERERKEKSVRTKKEVRGYNSSDKI